MTTTVGKITIIFFNLSRMSSVVLGLGSAMLTLNPFLLLAVPTVTLCFAAKYSSVPFDAAAHNAIEFYSEHNDIERCLQIFLEENRSRDYKSKSFCLLRAIFSSVQTDSLAERMQPRFPIFDPNPLEPNETAEAALAFFSQLIDDKITARPVLLDTIELALIAISRSPSL